MTRVLAVSFLFILGWHYLKMSFAFAVKSGDVAVMGCGVLGTSLCKQLLESSAFASKQVTGITKSDTRHASIQNEVGNDSERFHLKTADEINETFQNVVFCAPPSGFDDYPAAINDAITNIWAGPSGGGTFVFTSSGGIYGNEQDGSIVDESSPTANLETNPRVARLVAAERHCLENGGCCLRLAGLYTLERGPHNYWLSEDEPKAVKGRPDGIVNMLHYDDAASACLAALTTKAKSGIYLVSDGNPTTRQGICESALKAKMYSKRQMPTFEGNDNDALGKVYDGSKTNEALQWKPKYNSFDEFMESQS